MSNLDELRFRIVHASSEEPDFPACELDRNTPQTVGWVSQKYCEYPQEIGLKMERGIPRLKQVMILSHQTKIPRKVELYVGSGQEYFNANYKRLGFLPFDDNARSNYSAREMKSAYIDNLGNFLKLVIHEPHPNQKNLNGQVGIVAINILGKNDIKGQSQSEETVTNTRFNDTVLDSCLEKLKEAKRKAVEVEDYVAAKHVKIMENNMLRLGSKLTQLETSKRRAVADEDFDRAKEIKDEIDSLRREIEDKLYTIDAPGFGSNFDMSKKTTKSQSGPYSSPPRQMRVVREHINESEHDGNVEFSNRHAQKIKRVLDEEEFDVGHVPDYSGSSAKYSNARQKRVLHEEEFDPGNVKDYSGTSSKHSPHKRVLHEEIFDPMNALPGKNPIHNDNRPIRPKEREMYDDEDPDADEGGGHDDHLHGSDDEHPFSGLPRRNLLPEPEHLSTKARQTQELPLIMELIGEYRTRALFSSKSMPLREAAVKKTKMMLDEGEFRRNPGIMGAIPGLMAIVRVGLGDKMLQAYLASISLLEALLKVMKQMDMSEEDVSLALEAVLDILVARLSHDQYKLREASKNSLMLISDLFDVGTVMVSKSCLKPLPQNMVVAWRPICYRLIILLNILNEKGLGMKNSGITTETMLKFMKDAKTFTYSNGEVREHSKQICIALARIIGSEALLGQLAGVLKKTTYNDYRDAFEIELGKKKETVSAKSTDSPQVSLKNDLEPTKLIDSKADSNQRIVQEMVPPILEKPAEQSGFCCCCRTKPIIPEFAQGEHPFQGLANAEALPLPEKLNSKSRKIAAASNIMELIGEYRTRALFSNKSMPLREAAVKKTLDMLEKNEFQEKPGEKEAIPGLMGIVRVGLSDKMLQIYLASTNLLESVLKHMKKVKIARNEVAHLIEDVVDVLLDRLNDEFTAVCESSMQSLKLIAEISVLGATVVFNQCMSKMPKKHKKNWKTIEKRILIVHDIVSMTGMSEKSGVNADAILHFMKVTQTYTHKNEEVRDATKRLLCDVSKMVGAETLLPPLKSVLSKKLYSEYRESFGVVEDIKTIGGCIIS